MVLEWNNVTLGVDIDFNWLETYDYLVRSGHAYVSVSTQQVGVDVLKSWSPIRYGALDVTGAGRFTADELSFDIYSQVAQALRIETPQLLGGARGVKLILATGPSQSARFLLAASPYSKRRRPRWRW